MQPQVMINSQYIKDFSLEIPHAPAIFKELKAQPKISIELSVEYKHLEEKFFEVSLKTKINGDLEDKKFFIVELEYAAVVLADIEDEKRDEILKVLVPQQLFPFARSILANVMMDAGLPPLMLTPVDFASLYRKKEAQN